MLGGEVGVCAVHEAYCVWWWFRGGGRTTVTWSTPSSTVTFLEIDAVAGRRMIAADDMFCADSVDTWTCQRCPSNTRWTYDEHRHPTSP